MSHFKDKVILISGGSRGIGEAIIKKLAPDGAKIAILAKTDAPHPKLPGTIHSVASDLEALGAESLGIKCDLRSEEQVDEAIEKVVNKWGGIDIVINNASAILLSNTEQTPMKRFDLMHQVNARGTYMLSQKALPYLKKSQNPHILNLAPPLNMDPKWFKDHLAYTMAKYGMSMCVLGMAAEFAHIPIAVNALWPQTGIATAAIEMLAGKQGLKACRKPEIMADAAYWVLSQACEKVSGQFFIDEQVLRENGVTDFSCYAIDPEAKLLQDFFI